MPIQTIGINRQLGKLVFGGESPLTISHGAGRESFLPRPVTLLSTLLNGIR